MIVVKGDPISKKRPRFARIKGFVRTYDAQSEEKKTVITLLKSQIKELITGDVHMKLTFYVRIPKSYTKKRTLLCISGEEKPTKKPDLDNYVKFYLDCLNGIAWKDDSQVVDIVASKRYVEVPRTEIEIYGN